VFERKTENVSEDNSRDQTEVIVGEDRRRGPDFLQKKTRNGRVRRSMSRIKSAIHVRLKPVAHGETHY